MEQKELGQALKGMWIRRREQVKGECRLFQSKRNSRRKEQEQARESLGKVWASLISVQRQRIGEDGAQR